MSALSTPGGGGTTAQSKPTSGKQKYQKLDINSLYCANRNENSEPSSVKSQLSRKHGMQSLGKVPSTRRPPANLPSLKTETGQDPNANSISTTSTTTVSSPPTCISQTLPTSVSSSAAAAGGWVALPPPSSPHFRTEFPSLEAAAMPSHRDHAAPQPQLRPQTEGSWTCGGGAGVRPEAASSPAPPGPHHTPAFRAILPSFLKGSGGGGLGLGGLGALRSGGGAAPRHARAPATPRAVEVLTARPILRDDQISSLDDISRDAGWAQHDDIDYDQKLDFSDGESSAPHKGGRHARGEPERKPAEPGDEERLWAERRQKQTDEVAQAVARAKQRKEEEHRRQMRDANSQPSKDFRDRDRNDNREPDNRDKDRSEPRPADARDRPERQDVRDKERIDRDARDNRDRADNRDRERDKPEPRERSRNDRERPDRHEDKERADRDRFDRERERDRDRDRDRADRDRDFRDRDRDYAREREQNNPAFSKSFQANIPPRFLKQQQNRQQDEPQHKGWAFTGKPAPRRQDPPAYNAQRHPPHNGRRSYSRDYSDREDDFRRDKEGSGPQWRSEMQDYERTGRELDRSNSKEYKDFNEYRGKNDSDRKSLESSIDQSSRSAADKLSEVFERKSIGIIEPFASSESTQNLPLERRSTSSNVSRRESAEKDCLKTASWAEVTQEETNNILKSAVDNMSPPKDNKPLPTDNDDSKRNFHPAVTPSPQTIPISNSPVNSTAPQTQNKFTPNIQPVGNNQQPTQIVSAPNVQQAPLQQTIVMQTSTTDNQNVSKPTSQTLLNSQSEPFTSTQVQKSPSDHLPQSFAKAMYPAQKSEKESSENDSIVPKSNADIINVVKKNESPSEAIQNNVETVKRASEEKKSDVHSNVEQVNRFPGKEPVERKSSGSGSEKKSRGFGGGGGGGYAVYVRGWGSRESRGRRSHRSSRSNRASESDGSTDGTPNTERKERRRAPRSPRGPKKSDRPDDMNRPVLQEPSMSNDGMENREPFAPRGQPSRRGRGGFQGASRPPAPAKRVTGYGPPNTKSPFSQANRAVPKESEDSKEPSHPDDKGRSNNNKLRTGSSMGRGRDRRPKGAGAHSGEDENWETTSEHSEGGGTGGRRRSVPGRPQGQPQKGQGGRNQNLKNVSNPRNTSQGAKKDSSGDTKTADITEAMTDLKLSTAKKDDEVVDDGFQEVRNKKNSKESRGSSKEDNQQTSKQQTRSHSNQGGGRNGSSSRNPNDKSISRGAPQASGKNGQYERPRNANLAPRFVKQRQKQQLGMVGGYGPDTGAAPPPPAVNAWDKPLRGNADEAAEVVDSKSAHSSQRSTPAEALNECKAVPAPIVVPADKSGVLDGATPPVETIIFENTNYKTAPSEEALQQKYQMNSNVAKPQTEEMPTELEARAMPFNGEVRSRPRSIQELIGDNGRPAAEGEAASLGLQMTFDAAQKTEDSSDMKLDFAFDSDLGITEDKSAKTLLPRGVHMSTSNTISPLAADLNLKIASVKKVWEMPAVAEGGEAELQFAGFEEGGAEAGAPPNVCKVKPTQQLQSPPPQLYNHVGYQGYGGLSVPSPPAMLFNSSQQLVGSSQQPLQQGSLYGAFLDQSRTQFGGFPPSPYGAGSATPYNYQPPPDMFQSLPNQYRMAATAGGGAAFGQSGQLGNNPSTVLISSTSNSLMSATVKPSSQQIGAIGSKGGGVGGVGGVSAYQQQYLGYSAGVGEAPYSLPGLLPRPAPPASSYYSPYQPPAAPAPTYPLQFTQPAQSTPFNSQFLSTLQAAAVQQMQQQYRAPLQQQYAPPPPRHPHRQLKSPLHEHANGFAPLCDSASPTPKGPQNKPNKPPHSPPHHKYHAPPPHPPPAHTPHQHLPPQMVASGGGRCPAPRYPAPIQRPLAPAPPLYRAPQHPPPRHHAPRAALYYHHHQRNGGGERAPEPAGAAAEDAPDAAPAPDQPAPDDKPE